MGISPYLSSMYYRLYPLLFSFLVFGCETSNVTPPSDFPLSTVIESLEGIRETSITNRRFKQRDLQPLINQLPSAFAVDTAGRSVEDRPLWRVRWGSGTTTVLLWSQMHGDEPTATAALFDLFNWLSSSDTTTANLRELFAENLELTFLPMLNPDGAERYARRNALGIDLNRDALHLTSPEARLLKSERDRLNADWGFNLHDQSTYYGAGFPSSKSCGLSILAPAYDWGKTINEKRKDAMQLIARMNAIWQQDIPGQVGRYNDDFEPRAFGDNLQKWGTRTILIESGGLPNDPEKQEIRQLNLLALIAALHSIATGDYEAFTQDDYFAIPENKYNGMHQLRLERVLLDRPDGEFMMDIAFRRSERSLPPDFREFTSRGFISDVGDLHTFGAYENVPEQGLRARPGRALPGSYDSLAILKLVPWELYEKGYTAVVGKSWQLLHPMDDQLTILPPGRAADTIVAPGRNPGLLLYDKHDQLWGAVIDGRLRRQ
jgi:hypothetical protein